MLLATMNWCMQRPSNKTKTNHARRCEDLLMVFPFQIPGTSQPNSIKAAQVQRETVEPY